MKVMRSKAKAFRAWVDGGLATPGVGGKRAAPRTPAQLPSRSSARLDSVSTAASFNSTSTPIAHSPIGVAAIEPAVQRSVEYMVMETVRQAQLQAHGAGGPIRRIPQPKRAERAVLFAPAGQRVYQVRNRRCTAHRSNLFSSGALPWSPHKSHPTVRVQACCCQRTKGVP